MSKFLVVATLIMNLAYAASDPECPCCRVKVSGSMNEHIRKCKSCGESTLSKGAEIQKVKTKYLEGQQV